MNFGKAGWLAALVAEEVAAHRPPADVSERGRAAARAFVRASLSAPLFAVQAPLGGGGEALLFAAVVRKLVRSVLDVAEVVQAPSGPRAAQAVMLLGALTCGPKAAERAAVRLPVLPLKVVRQVELALERRAASLTQGRAYGLVLHNGSAWIDAELLVHLALGYFSRGRFVRRAAERLVALAGRKKALLVEILVAQAGADRRPDPLARKAILAQVDALGLPLGASFPLRRRLRRSFDRRPDIALLARGAKSRRARRFYLEQAVLGARADGRASRRDRAFLAELAAALRFSPPELVRVEVETAEFYQRHRHLVDVFSEADAAGYVGEEVVESIQQAVEENLHRVLTEIRETGELSVLLTRAAPSGES
jgi:hypothetical protein